MKRILIAIGLLWTASTAHAGLIASVEHDADTVILRFPLYDYAAPEECASDVTTATTGLEINVSTDVSDGYYDQFRQTDSTLEAITTIGTYATPTATKARFEIIATGACTYELQLPDAAFAVADANLMTIEVTDGGTEILDAFYWVDLTPISSTNLIAALLDTPCTSYATDDDVGYQLCTALDAILTDTGTTLDNKLDTVVTNTDRVILHSDTVDTGGVISTTVLALTSGFGVDDKWIGSMLCIEDADNSNIPSCATVTDYVESTTRVTYDSAVDFTVAEGDAVLVYPTPVTVADVLAGQVEDQDGGYDLQCALSTLLAYAAGDVNTSGGVSTYQDPGANEDRIVGTVSGSSRTSITITCP